MLTMKRGIVSELFDHAQKGFPNEVCGFLAGKDHFILKHYPLTNVDHSPEHFSMDPQEQLAAVKDMRSQGFSLLACYHSHPSTPARPSDEDMRLAYDPNISYVIISLKGGSKTIRSFKIKNYDAIVENIVVVKDEEVSL